MREDGAPRYSSIFADEFNARFLALPESVCDRVDNTIDLLELMPHLGHPYDPAYEASLPPVSCMQVFVPDTYCALYYAIDERNRELHFFYLGDTRENPRTMF